MQSINNGLSYKCKQTLQKMQTIAGHLPRADRLPHQKRFYNFTAKKFSLQACYWGVAAIFARK